MTSDREVRRLEEVYQGYEDEGRRRDRWGLGNRGNQAIMAERRRVMEAVLGDGGFLPLARRRILEVGCGTGHVLAGLRELGAEAERLVGVELIEARCAQARASYPEIDFRVGNAEGLDFEDASFDLVLLFVVFSSILDAPMRANVARECARVVRPGGAVLWYDFRYDNPSNPHVRGMRRGEIEQLFPGFDVSLRTLTVVPQLVRRLGPLTDVVYPLLAAVRPLRTYHMGLLTKKSPGR